MALDLYGSKTEIQKSSEQICCVTIAYLKESFSRKFLPRNKKNLSFGSKMGWMYTRVNMVWWWFFPELSKVLLSLNLFAFFYVIKGDSRKKASVSPDETITAPRCSKGCEPIAKPIVDSSATVYVILGLKAIDRSKIIRESVLTKKVLLSI